MYYKDSENKLHWIEDESFEYLLPPGCVRIGDEEARVISKELQDAIDAPTPEQVLHSANAKRDDLLAVAALRIAPLQDASDVGDASEEDDAMLIRWKTYRVAVNRVGRQKGFPESIDWPVAPDQ